MSNKYYLQELDKLRNSSKEFAAKYPAIAERLFEPSIDHDIERLLEGVAFLGADMRQRIDEEYPELLQSIMSLLCPDLLKPLPSTTMLEFRTRPSTISSEYIKAGTQVETAPSYFSKIPVKFSTSYPIDVLPIICHQIECSTDVEGKSVCKMSFHAATELNKLNFKKLNLYLSGDYVEVSNLFYLLSTKTADISVRSGNIKHLLKASDLQPANFNSNKMLYSSNLNDIPTFGLLRDYFIFPKKFLFFELDISSWEERGDNQDFSIAFSLETSHLEVPKDVTARVVLNAVPAVNIMQMKNYVVNNEFRHQDVMLNVIGAEGEPLDVVSIEKVESLGSDNRDQKKVYKPFGMWSVRDNTPSYQLKYNHSSVRTDALLSIAYPGEGLPLQETLVLDVTATQGKLAEKVAPNSVVVRKEGISEKVEFTNISKPTKYIGPTDNASLPYITSHLAFSISESLQLDDLKLLIKRYIPVDRDMAGRIRQQQIDGLLSLEITAEEDIFGQHIITGQQVRIEVMSTHFICIGDVYILGSIINAVISSCTPINSYTALKIIDKHSGEEMVWPKQLGMEQEI